MPETEAWVKGLGLATTVPTAQSPSPS